MTVVPGGLWTTARPATGRRAKPTGLRPFLLTGRVPHTSAMGYEVTITDSSTELVLGADTYQQEGQLTTFFATEPGRMQVDSWSTRLASFRTSEILRIRRLSRAAAAA